MQQETLPILAGERVDDLFVLAGAEGGNDERLGFAAGEQHRAMGSRQEPDLAIDRPHRLRVAAVDPRSIAQDGAAHDLLLDVLEQLEGEGTVILAVEQACRIRLGGVDPVAALLLAALAIGRIDVRPDRLAQPGFDRGLVGGRSGEIPRLLGTGLGRAR